LNHERISQKIDLQNNSKTYQENLQALGVFLQSTIQELDTCAINLRCQGDLSHWNKSKNEGEEFVFEIDEVYKADDKNIEKIYVLRCAIEEYLKDTFGIVY
jgi:hypothetical protein